MKQQNLSAEAQIIFTLMASRFLLDSENVTQIGESGRYWMSRCLFELGDLLEYGNEFAEARRVYRKIIAYSLPGRRLAQSRADALHAVGE